MHWLRKVAKLDLVRTVEILAGRRATSQKGTGTKSNAKRRASEVKYQKLYSAKYFPRWQIVPERLVTRLGSRSSANFGGEHRENGHSIGRRLVEEASRLYRLNQANKSNKMRTSEVQ